MIEDFVSCMLIGENSLIIECGNILLKHNWKIEAVVTDKEEAIKWAKINSIPVFKSNEINNIKNLNIDYLFSIVNSLIIPDRILNSVKKLAINYHDAPLPKYAGVHATSWAISNRERRHGISWHIMTDVIDGGDVLVQERVVVKCDDTAESLNLKCFQAAIKGFNELVDSIENNSIIFRKQNLDDRSYFGKFEKLNRNGLVDWNQRDKDVIRYVNSTLFGREDNDFLTAKIYYNGRFYIIDKIENYCSEFYGNAGDAKVINNEFVVAAKNRPLVFSVREITGEKVNLSCFGDDIKSLNADDSIVDELADSIDATKKSERYWVGKLKKYKDNKNNKLIFNPSMETQIDTGILSGMCLLEKILLYFYQSVINNGIDSYFLGFFDSRNTYSDICSDIVPFVIRNNNPDSLEEILEEEKKELSEIEKNKTFLLDVHYRYPSLSGVKKVYDYVIIADEGNGNYQNKSNKLTIVIDKNNNYRMLPADEEGQRVANELIALL